MAHLLALPASSCQVPRFRVIPPGAKEPRERPCMGLTWGSSDALVTPALAWVVHSKLERTQKRHLPPGQSVRGLQRKPLNGACGPH